MNNILKEFIDNYNQKGFLLDTISISKEGKQSITYGNNQRLNLQSCSKTITAIAFGIAMKEYSISLDDKAFAYFPEYEKTMSCGTEDITLRDLLRMSSGKKLRSLRDSPQKEKWRIDWLSWFFESPQNEKAGSIFYYSSLGCYVVGRIIEKITNMAINDYLYLRLWKTLDIQKPEWSICPLGHTICAGNIWLTNNDFSKIGHIIINKGEYKKHRIIDEFYIQKMITDVIPSYDPFLHNDVECSYGYGYFLWKGSLDNVFRIWGTGGNFCILDYIKKLYVTVTAEINLVNKNSDHEIVRGVYGLIDKYF